jgi:hypothetical protein
MAFEDISVHVRFKLFALWSSVMFFLHLWRLFPAVGNRAVATNDRGKDALRC